MKIGEFKDLLYLATKELYFVFNNILCQQIVGTAMGSPLGPSLANAFLAHHEQNWLDNCTLNIDHHIIDRMLMIYLYFSNHLIT